MDELKWLSAPKNATHWDLAAGVWCTQKEYWHHTGCWINSGQKEAWGDASRYIPRPEAPTDEGIPKGAYHLGNMRQDVPTPTPHKYHRQIIGLCGTAVFVDIDRALEAYKPAYPQLAHAAKKALCAGTRGHKSLRQDILDIIESAENALALHDQIEALK
jgi:hypothetical protein